MQTIIDRLNIAQDIASKAPSEASRKMLLADQHAALLEAFASMTNIKPDLPQKAQVTVLILKLYEGDQMQSLLAALEHCSSSSKKKAAALQRYVSLENYLIEAEWGVLMSGAPYASKRSVVIRRAISLGCYAPCERTFKRWCALVDLASVGYQKALELSTEHRRSSLESLKKEFRRCRRGAMPTDYLLELPDNPVDLKASHNVLWKAAYGEGDVAATQVNMHELISIDESANCRSSKLRTEHDKQAVAVSSNSAQRNEMAQMMMSTFQQMQKDNRDFLMSMMRCKAHAGAPQMDTVPITIFNKPPADVQASLPQREEAAITIARGVEDDLSIKPVEDDLSNKPVERDSEHLAAVTDDPAITKAASHTPEAQEPSSAASGENLYYTDRSFEASIFCVFFY